LLKFFLRHWNCDLICIQGTKLEEVELADVRSIWGNQAASFAVLKAIGAVGRILVLWNKNSFHLISSYCGEFSITCFLQMGDGSTSWAFTGVYGPHVRVDKLRTWDELRWIRDGWSGPWCLGGDFNEILHSQEMSTGVCPSNAMVEFQDFINYLALLDLPLKGGNFTWSSSGDESVCSD